jgi:predicted Rossmann fold flavoprotein
MGSDNNKKKNIAIIGAGAAGLVAAFYALEGGNSVTIFEKNDIAGKKLRITGNGRCNFTNEDLKVSHYAHGTDTGFIDSVLKKNGKDEFITFLDQCGIPSFQKNGYYYPLSERAGEVTDLLVKVLLRKGVKIQLGEDFHEVLRNTDATFNLNGEKFDVLILACGGKAAPATGSDGSGFKLARSFGHTVSFTYPVLVPLKADQKILKEIF